MKLGKVRDALEEKGPTEISFVVAHSGFGPVDCECFVVDLPAGKEEEVLRVASASVENTTSAADWQGFRPGRLKVQRHLGTSEGVAVDVEAQLCRDQLEERRLEVAGRRVLGTASISHSDADFWWKN